MTLHPLRVSTLLILLAAGRAFAADFPAFDAVQIDKSLKIGYGVILADLNADNKPDIVVADKERLIWFENPSWKLHTIVEGKTKKDNVCLDAYDIDGDGRLDIALGAGWQPGNTKEPSTLQWFRQPKNIDDPWDMFSIACDEPTIHRIRFADLAGSGKKQLIMTPLQGRGATAKNNWSEAGVRVYAYSIPKADPTSSKWEPELITDALPIMHNFQAVDLNADGKLDLITATYDGVHLHTRSADGKWSAQKIGDGDQSKPNTNRGSSEIKLGKLKDGRLFIATIEPWHGHQVVVYTAPPKGEGKWVRHVIDDQLKWGHAVWCADLDNDGDDELIIGVRDPLNEKIKSGINLYKPADLAAGKWDKFALDNGGVAVEDLAAGDLNADGRTDIVAVGRATGNVKVYLNKGK